MILMDNRQLNDQINNYICSSSIRIRYGENWTEIYGAEEGAHAGDTRDTFTLNTDEFITGVDSYSGHSHLYPPYYVLTQLRLHTNQRSFLTVGGRPMAGKPLADFSKCWGRLRYIDGEYGGLLDGLTFHVDNCDI